MVSCCVPTCNSNSRNQPKSSGVGFHRFPCDTKRKEIWSEIVMKQKWDPSVNSRLCSKHFTDNDFFCTKTGRKKLCESAVPSLLLPSSIEDTLIKIKKSQPDDPDVQYDESDSPKTRRLKYRIICLEDIAYRHRNRISTLRQTVRRLQQKLVSMNRLVIHLKHRKYNIKKSSLSNI